MSEGGGISNRWVVLALLATAYALNGADRQMIAVLAEPIRKELLLSDGQLGLLSGFMFAAFYVVVGIPVAWLADRANRVRIVAAAVLFWSLCTAASGMAASFAQLALARIGVAVGEAGCSPPSYSLLSDYFPAKRRATALGLYTVGFPVGTAMGTAFGGWIAAHHGWRAAFLAMTAPGVVMSVALLLFVRHPARGRLDEGVGEAPAALPLTAVMREFFSRPVLWVTTFASCLGAFTTAALIAWLPAFLMRAKGMAMIDLAQSYSLVTGVSMVTGMGLSGLVVDRFGSGNGRAAATVPAIGFLVATPLVAAALWTDSWQMALAFMVVPFILTMMWLPPALATLQNFSRPESRAVTSSIYLLLTGLVGTGGGPASVGLMSNLIGGTPSHSLQWALTATVPFLALAGLAHFAMGAALRAEARAATG